MKRVFNHLLLHQLMIERGLNMASLAKELDVSPSEVARWLKGSIPRDDKIELLSDYFGKEPIDWFNINFPLYLYPIPRINIVSGGIAYSLREMDKTYIRKHYTNLIIGAMQRIKQLLEQGVSLQEAVTEANEQIETQIRGMGLGRIEEPLETAVEDLWEEE